MKKSYWNEEAFISLLRMKNEDVDGVKNVIGDDYVSGPDGNNESISCHRKLT